MDEVSASGPTVVAEYADGAVRTWEIDPETVGIALVSPRSIEGGDAARNAEILLDVLRGEHGAPRDTTLMNAAAALLVAGRVEDLAEGVARSRESIDDGRAYARLQALIALSGRLGAEADASKEAGS
jgi:anthranilate phosphoribosyltransferase